jgi:type IV pilus assembly protein PilB
LDFLRSHYRLLPRLTSRDSLTRALLYYQQHLRELYGKKLQDPTATDLLDTLLRHALHSRATDLHLQSDATGLLVRYRINRVLKDAMTLPLAAGNNVITKLRTLAHVPSSTLPREGALRVDLGSGEDISIRVSSVPIVGGEKLVLHLSREKMRRGHTLESLGLHGEALEAVHKALLKRRGLILVSGKGGGGKSTMLYTLLDVLNSPDVSIASVEHDVEYTLPRVAQTDIGTQGVGAVAALRAALKADCDVVMISNVVDEQVARIATAAAERGILVLAGTEQSELFPKADVHIHTAVIQRLGQTQMADKHKLSRAQGDALEVNVSFPRILGALKEERKITKDTPWKDVQFTRATSSTEHPTGYKGLLGVQEVRVEGRVAGLTLVEDGVFKAAIGLTSVEEVLKLL